MPHQDTVVVEMLVQTIKPHNGNLYRLRPGQQVEVPEDLAQLWEGNGIAKVVDNKQRAARKVEEPMAPARLGDHRSMQEAERVYHEQSPERQDVVRTDLRIASNHGDVAAARRLDAMGEPGERATNAPLTMTDEGPGDFGQGERAPQPTMPQPVSPEARAARAAATEGDGGAAPKTSTGASARAALGGGGKG